MESSNLVPVVALLVAAAVVALLLLRFMRSRHGGDVKPLPGPGNSPPAPPEDADYLDSSHIGGPILPGGDPSQSDAAARAAAALRNSRRK